MPTNITALFKQSPQNMIYQGNLVTVTFAPKKLATAHAALQRMGWAQCDWVSLYGYNAVLSDVKDNFQENETLQMGLDNSVTAAIITNTQNLVSKFNFDSLSID